MNTSMVLTALFMGLVGGPHCLAMCGAACTGIASAAGPRATQALWTFQLSRIAGYATLGGVVAVSVQGLGWLGAHTAVLRPVWTMFHVAAIVLGLALLWQARQPAWVDGVAQRVWRQAKPRIQALGPRAPVVLGVGWALMPCGLLYSALLVAALTSSSVDGALTMALFALGSSVSLWAGPWLWLRLQTLGDGAWGMRLAGLALLTVSAWGLWMGLVHDQAPWCVTPV